MRIAPVGWGLICLAAGAIFLATVSPGVAQATRPNAGAKPAAAERPRRIPPGVFQTITPELQTSETFSRADLVRILDLPELKWPNEFVPKSQTAIELSKGVVFRHDIWGLEFQFKPVRFVTLNVPDENGLVRTSNVWYMLYRVRNPGGAVRLKVGEDGLSKPEAVDEAIKFTPHFWLQADDRNKPHRARLLTVAHAAIEKRERPPQPLLDIVQIAQKPIEPSSADQPKYTWGVVTWEGIDPSVDDFTVYVQGLTNAYRWKEAAVEGQAGQFSTQYEFRTLKLNFWRPGDEFDANENEIRYGAPGKPNFEWTFSAPE